MEVRIIRLPRSTVTQVRQYLVLKQKRDQTRVWQSVVGQSGSIRIGPERSRGRSRASEMGSAPGTSGNSERVGGRRWVRVTDLQDEAP